MKYMTEYQLLPLADELTREVVTPKTLLAMKELGGMVISSAKITQTMDNFVTVELTFDISPKTCGFLEYNVSFKGWRPLVAAFINNPKRRFQYSPFSKNFVRSTRTYEM